jgi:hypothetical protein
MIKENTKWKWRTGEMSYKEFQRLPNTTKMNYIKLVEQLKPQERSTSDEIILNQYSKNINTIKNFYSLDELD